MNAISFLDQVEAQKITIVEYIHQNQRSITIADLQKDLGISDYLSAKLIAEIEEDFFLYLNKRPYIFSEGVFENIKIFNEDILLLKSNYFKQTLKSKMFDLLSFENKKLKDFSRENFLGMTKTYNLRSSIKEILEQYDITIKENKLVGDEGNIRQLIFNVYYYFFNGIEYPFDEETQQKCHKLIYFLEINENIHLTLTQRTKIEFYLSIAILRQNKHYFINKKNGNFSLDTIYKLKKFFMKELDIPEEQVLNEISDFYLFLRINRMVDMDYFEVNMEDNDLLVKLNHLFFQELSRTLKLDTEKRLIIEKKMRSNITAIHEKILFFANISNTFIDEEQIAYFQENYFVFHHFSVNFINEKLTGLFPGLDKEAKVNIYYDYIFELIDNIDIAEIEKPVNVTVDFSNGRTYSNYIAKNIQSLSNLNVEISNTIRSDTQIYISDYYNYKLDTHQVIWKNPPNEYDWEYLVNLIVNLKDVEIEK
jgi:hypothetical protein